MRELGFDSFPAPVQQAGRGYSTPRLTVYGLVADLTAAGSAGPSESNGDKCASMENMYHDCMV